MTPTFKMHKGDALAVLRDMPSGSVDAVITDPPYSSGGRRENARSIRSSMIRSTEDDQWIAGDSMSTQGFIWTMRTVAMDVRRVLKPGGHFLSFIDWRMAPNLAVAIESADMRAHPWLVWDKTYFGMGSIFRNQHEFILHFTSGNPSAPARRDVGNVIPCPPIRGGVHPTEKPVTLMRKLVSVVTHPGETVLDPFAGSAATGVAALAEGRNFVGVEMTDHYHAVAERRLREAAQGYKDDGEQMVLGGAA